MVFVEGPYQDSTHKTAQHLGHDIATNAGPGEGSGNSQSQRHRRIEVCTGNRTGHQHTHHYCQAPAQRNYHPSGTLCLGFIQGTGGANPVAKQHQNQRADKFK